MTAAVPPLPAPYLRQILAHPDDDGPRLVAADWWDERGAAERAEFVRVQCELARRYPGWSGVPAPDSLGAGGPYAELRRRERELRTYDNVISWLPVVEPWGAFLSATCASHLGPGDAHCCNGPSPIAKAEFRRGFVEELTAAAADFLTHADALTAACPLRKVRLTTWPEVELTRINARDGFRLVGRRYVIHSIVVRSGEPLREAYARRLLAAEFLGIDFELPPTGRVTEPREGTRG
jgi:uncharacterized protein (TIGR02996 family)